MENSIITYALVFVICICLRMDHVKSNTLYTGKKFENLLQNYLKPMRKISDYFPNRAVELQLEMGGDKARIVSVPKKKLPTKTYLRLQKPAFLITRSKDTPEIQSISTTTSTPESIQMTLSQTTSSTHTSSTIQDPEEKLISWKDLKSIMGELDNELNIGSSEDQPVKKRDLWIALGMKYGLKCNDNSKQLNTEVKSSWPQDNNLQKILQLLKEGKVVDRNSKDPSSGENLHWFKIKVPKNI